MDEAFNANVIADGRITIPDEIRKKHDLREGDTVTVKILAFFKAPRNKKKET